jgi:hypothetical protein
MAMSETSEQLVLVSVDGRGLSSGHAVLIHAPWGWHVALYSVPAHSCPLLGQQCEIVVVTSAGHRYEGRASAEVVAANGVYVLLTGVDPLRLIAPADAA